MVSDLQKVGCRAYVSYVSMYVLCLRLNALHGAASPLKTPNPLVRLVGCRPVVWNSNTHHRTKWLGLFLASSTHAERVIINKPPRGRMIPAPKMPQMPRNVGSPSTLRNHPTRFLIGHRRLVPRVVIGWDVPWGFSGTSNSPPPL